MNLDLIALYDGQVMQTHPATSCTLPCAVHGPSQHPLAGAPLNWRADLAIFERICPHGVGHPDPDDLAYLLACISKARYQMHAADSHGCDGCCEGRC